MIAADDSNDMFCDWEQLRQAAELLMTPEDKLIAVLSVDPSGLTHEELADYLDLIEDLTKQRITSEERLRRLNEIKRKVAE